MTDYPPNLRVAPLTDWPGPLTPDDSRQRSPFSAPLSGTLTLLTAELDHLGARTPVLEVAIDQAQFRIDGRPRATARADHPGVVLSLPTTRVGPLRYATDRFDRWQDNLRAIALGLEALRKVERYGITRSGEQYRGFAALPPGDPPLTPATARAYLATESGTQIPDRADRDTITRAYRAAAKRLHPDAGGTAAGFRRLQQAVDLLTGATR